MIYIPLTRGQWALVDDDDIVLVGRYNWCVSQNRNVLYATTSIHKKSVYMHRLILGLTQTNTHTDHRNGNGLDNRRENLRIATPSLNGANVPKQSMTGFRGVYVHPNTRRYVARIRDSGGRKLHLGFFDTKEEAAFAYDTAAKSIHGEFAILNGSHMKEVKL